MPPSKGVMRSRRVSLTTLMCCAVLVSGCVAGVAGGSALIDRLNGRGPVLLASDNPYLPANRLLKEELESSGKLRDFVEQRGKPTALGVNRGLLQRPEIRLYYPEQGEVYSFKRRNGDWVTLGPEELLSAERYALADYKSTDGAIGNSGVVSPGAGSPPTGLASLKHEPLSSARASLKPPSYVRQAPFKRLPSGTYLHTVTFKGETLQKLADWYAGSPTYAAALAKVNRVPLHKTLTKGAKISLPRGIVRNAAPFPEAALR